MKLIFFSNKKIKFKILKNKAINQKKFKAMKLEPIRFKPAK